MSGSESVCRKQHPAMGTWVAMKVCAMTSYNGRSKSLDSVRKCEKTWLPRIQRMSRILINERVKCISPVAVFHSSVHGLSYYLMFLCCQCVKGGSWVGESKIMSSYVGSGRMGSGSIATDLLRSITIHYNQIYWSSVMQNFHCYVTRLVTNYLLPFLFCCT
jgi:hypothetical protein